MPETFYLFLLGHIVGDFYLQSEKIAKEKQAEAAAVVAHSALYCAVALVASVPVMFLNVWAGILAAGVLSLAHCIIDLAKFYARRKYDAPDSFAVFFIDQALHIAVILAVSNMLLDYVSNGGLTALFHDAANISYLATVKLLCVLFLMGRPANISFKKIFKSVKPENDEKSGMKNAGALIGTLERVISCVMFYLGQYAAIAIVFTAKSIARYNRISTDPAFAEYYLTGTLSSVTIAILVSMLFFQYI